MNVNNNLQGLQQLFSSQEVAPANSRSGGSREATARTGTDRATLSSAGSVASASAPDSDVRMDKVTAVQEALAAGTYNVPASQVADRMIDCLLGK